MFTDYVLNGQGHGELGNHLSQIRFDANLMRPFVDQGNRKCLMVNTGEMIWNEELKRPVPVQKKMLLKECVDRGIVPVMNAQTVLRKDEWLLMDSLVLKAARKRLRAWSDLSAVSSFGGFNGMAKTVLEHERMTDPGEAVVDMDGLTEGRGDTPQFQLEGIPLPITHVDFNFSARKLAVSRNGGTPLDMSMSEAAGRRVAETIEKTLIGTETGVTYGDKTGRGYDNTPTVRGYTNHPDRITYTSITTPTGANPDQTVADVLAMRDLAYAQNFFGPFMLYHSNDWDQFMDNDYVTGTAAQGLAAPSETLRTRLQKITEITDVRRLDYFTPSTTFQLLLVSMTSETVRAIDGMGITTVQWESKGGMQLNFKVMAIQVPEIRSQYIDQSTANSAAKCGIVHGTRS